MEQTSWKPERKIVAAAIATLAVWAVQASGLVVDVPVGVEGAVAVIVGYLIPNRG